MEEALKGTPIDNRDLLIGVTAIFNGLPLWPGNEKHFERLLENGLKLWTL